MSVPQKEVLKTEGTSVIECISSSTANRLASRFVIKTLSQMLDDSSTHTTILQNVTLEIV
jgi:hypothetical protein